MNILLTGAFGNVGSNTIPELLKRGHSVRAFDVRSQRNERTAERLTKGENGRQLEIVWGDIRDKKSVETALKDQEIVIHLAAIIPPVSYENPDRTYQVNVIGTQNVIAAAQQQPVPPRLIYASTLDVFGYTQDQQPPRRVTDPMKATDNYSEHKIACEGYVKASGLTWLILRFADVPPLETREPHPIMFRIPLNNRLEMIHPVDLALAIANATTTPEAWNKILLIGGGPSCQMTYRQYLTSFLSLMGIGMLPDAAFGTEPWCTDWLDTEESQRLLHYQRHSFQDFLSDLRGVMGIQPMLVRIISPVVRWSLLRTSPYLKKA
jgi:nucleoside-diphosphate-sugar epimerase